MQFRMMHLSSTNDPAITSFSFSPSTFVLISNQILLFYTYNVKLESLADYWEGWDLTVEVARVRRIRGFQLQRTSIVFIPSPQLQSTKILRKQGHLRILNKF